MSVFLKLFSYITGTKGRDRQTDGHNTRTTYAMRNAISNKKDRTRLVYDTVD